MSILNGNQDDVANGGTGTLDGTWITYTNGQTMPNGNVCTDTFCTTAPFGPATPNPCIEAQPSWTQCNTNNPPPGVSIEGSFCYWSTSNPFNGGPAPLNGLNFWQNNGGQSNIFWIAGGTQPNMGW